MKYFIPLLLCLGFSLSAQNWYRIENQDDQSSLILQAADESLALIRAHEMTQETISNLEIIEIPMPSHIYSMGISPAENHRRFQLWVMNKSLGETQRVIVDIPEEEIGDSPAVTVQQWGYHRVITEVWTAQNPAPELHFWGIEELVASGDIEALPPAPEAFFSDSDFVADDLSDFTSSGLLENSWKRLLVHVDSDTSLEICMVYNEERGSEALEDLLSGLGMDIHGEVQLLADLPGCPYEVRTPQDSLAPRTSLFLYDQEQQKLVQVLADVLQSTLDLEEGTRRTRLLRQQAWSCFDRTHISRRMRLTEDNVSLVHVEPFELP